LTGITFIRLKDKYRTTGSKYLVEVEKMVDMEENVHKTKQIRPFFHQMKELLA